MIRCGITGNIGSGKSTISKLFQQLGVPVFNSDQCARDAEANVAVQKAFMDILGEDIFVNNQIDRVKMRQVIFTDRDKLAQVNAVITPYVKDEFEKFISDNKGAPYVMLESAILFETKSDKVFDYIVNVTADEAIRVKRVLARDNGTLEEVQNKLKNQYTNEYKIAHSDFNITNNYVSLEEALNPLTVDVEAIDKHIRLTKEEEQ